MASTSPSQWPAATIPHGLCVSASLFHTHTPKHKTELGEWKCGWWEKDRENTVKGWREKKREVQLMEREDSEGTTKEEKVWWKEAEQQQAGEKDREWKCGSKWVEIVVSLILLPLRKGLNPHSCRWECRGHIMSSQSSPAPKRRLLSHRSWNSWRKPFHLSRFLIYTSSCCMGSMKCSNMWVFLGKPNHNSSLT